MDPLGLGSSSKPKVVPKRHSSANPTVAITIIEGKKLMDFILEVSKISAKRRPPFRTNFSIRSANSSAENKQSDAVFVRLYRV